MEPLDKIESLQAHVGVIGALTVEGAAHAVAELLDVHAAVRVVGRVDGGLAYRVVFERHELRGGAADEIAGGCCRERPGVHVVA